MSPQPEANTAALAAKCDAPMRFLTDRDNRAAVILGIRERMGNPLPADVTMERFSASLDRLNRVAIGITPERILSNE